MLTSEVIEKNIKQKYKYNNKIPLKDSGKKSACMTIQFTDKGTEIHKILVDGGCHEKNTAQKRCDWALRVVNEESQKYVFTELKSDGNDWQDALIQIQTTIEDFNAAFSVLSIHSAHIVVNRNCIPKSDTSGQNAKIQFDLKYNAPLYIEQTPYFFQTKWEHEVSR